MERRREPANFVVRYNSDPTKVTDNHKSDHVFLLDTDERNFEDRGEAIQFLSECISPITTLQELVPELKGVRKFNFLLPDRNIKVKHQVCSSMDDVLGDTERWT